MARYTHEASPWKKRILLPIWIIRDGLTLITIILYAYILSVLVDDPTNRLEQDFDHRDLVTAKAIVAVFMTAFIISLLLDAWCMVQYVRHSLSPLVFLVINSVQLLFWIVIVIIQFASAATYGRAFSSVFEVACLLLYVGLFAYAFIVYRRERARRATTQAGRYELAAEAAKPVEHPPQYH